MRNSITLLVLVFVLMLSSGCSMTLPHTAPGDEARYLAAPEEVEILGEVTGMAEGQFVLTIPFDGGDAGFEKAYQDALKKSGADALIDVRSDVEYTYILPPLYQKYVTTVTGTAIKYVR